MFRACPKLKSLLQRFENENVYINEIYLISDIVVSEHPGSGSDPPIGSGQKGVLHKILNVFLYPTPVILAMKIMVHLCATWMHSKTGAMELLKDLLSQIYRLGNHNPFHIPKTTIHVNGPVFITCIRSYLVPGGRYLCVLSLRLYHSTQ